MGERRPVTVIPVCLEGRHVWEGSSDSCECGGRDYGALPGRVPGLALIQAELAQWLLVHHLHRDALRHMRKLDEEVEELREAVTELDCLGPIGGTDSYRAEIERNLRDETADVVLVCMAIAAHHRFDLGEAIASKWAEVKAR